MRVRILIALAAVVAGCAATVATAAPTARTAATPTLEVRPRAARPGGEVVLRGEGFPARVRVKLLAGPPDSEATQIGRATTDAEGAFVAPIRIERGVEPGRYVALACRSNCRIKASAPFRVLAPR